MYVPPEMHTQSLKQHSERTRYTTPDSRCPPPRPAPVTGGRLTPSPELEAAPEEVARTERAAALPKVKLSTDTQGRKASRCHCQQKRGILTG